MLYNSFRMLCGRSLAGSSLALTLLLGACQPDRPAEAGHATPTVRPVPQVPPPAPTPPAAKATLRAAVRPEKQTLFPDSLHPIALTADYWTGRQLNSRRAALPNTDTIVMGSNVVQWAARCRVLRTGDYDNELRLFIRLPTQPMRWAELDLNAWLAEYTQLAYMKARLVGLDQRPPEELLVELGGGIYASGLREVLGHTVLIPFDGPPRVIWHSVDGRNQEIPPTHNNAQGEMLGGSYGGWSRKVTVGRGRVQVSCVRREGGFEDQSSPGFTPITPGSYQYRAGRFRRVSP